MKDFLGRPLKVGDTVVMMAPNYRSLVKAEIIGETPKCFRVRFTNTWNFGNGMVQETIQFPNQLVLIPEGI